VTAVKESQQTGQVDWDEDEEEEEEEELDEMTALLFIDSIVDQGWVIFGHVTFFSHGSQG
jgi:hypothetical protein